MALLDVDDIHVFYDKIEALKGISLTVEERKIVTLVGGNGAGKSTTLRAISGLLHPRHGEIRFAGRTLDGARCARYRGDRRGAGAGRTPHLRPLDSRGEPGDGRLHPARARRHRGRPGGDDGALPAPARTAEAGCRDVVGRRAADACRRPGANGPAAPAADGRAEHGPRANAGRAGVRDDPDVSMPRG